MVKASLLIPSLSERYIEKEFIQYGTVEYFIPMADTGPRGDSHHQLEGMFKKVRPARPQPF